jgi:hypothetical protein
MFHHWRGRYMSCRSLDNCDGGHMLSYWRCDMGRCDGGRGMSSNNWSRYVRSDRRFGDCVFSDLVVGGSSESKEATCKETFREVHRVERV